ncbi:MAG: M20 family metallopeptidase, partial [Candidatus Zixiibacteriota bacterium]
PNIGAVAELGGSSRFLVFSGHSDTVAPASDWSTDPFEAHENDGRLYGLGSVNMKSGLACMLTALRGLIEHHDWPKNAGRVGLAVTVDQEGRSLGARALLKTEYGRCDAMLHGEHFFGDSPECYLPVAVTGKVLYRLTVRGRAAHAFRPHLGGINAVGDAAQIVTALDRLNLRDHPLFGKGTVCALKIDGGYRQYAMVVPERCEIVITRLTVPGESVKSAIEDMRRLVDSLGLKSEVEIETPPPAYEPYRLDEKAPFVKLFSEVYEDVIGVKPHFAGHQGIVDANVFVAEGKIPTVVFGPKGGRHHQAGEYVELASLEPVARVYAETAVRFFENESTGV